MKKGSELDPCFILRGLAGSVTAVSYVQQENGHEDLLTGFSEGAIKLWDLKSRRPSVTLVSHNGKSILKAHALSGQRLLSHGRDGIITIWRWKEDIFVNQTMFQCSDLTFSMCAISHETSPNVQWVAYPSSNSQQNQIEAKLLNGSEEKSVIDFGKSRGMVMQLQFITIASRLFLLVGLEDGSIALWDIINAKQLTIIQLFNDPVMCMDADRMGRVVAGSSGNELKSSALLENNDKSSWDFSEAKSTVTQCSGYASIAIRGDGKITAAGGWDGRIRVFSWKTMRLLAVLKYHTQTINSLAFSSDGYLAVGSADGKITVWGVYLDKPK